MANNVLKFTYMVPWAVLLFLGTVGHKVKRAETSGNGHCSAPSVTEGQQGELTFNLPPDIQMDAPKFYVNLRRAAEPAKDILHCDRANQVSAIECGVTDTSFETDKILENHSLMVRIPKTTMEYDDLYTLYVYVDGKVKTPIACNFTVKAEVHTKDEENTSNAWIAAVVVVFIIGVVIVAVVICVRRRCNHNPREDPEGGVHMLPLIGSWRKSKDTDSHKEKRWYFETITEEEENKLLQFKRNGQGSFLMRHGHTNPNDYILAVFRNDEIKRLTISHEGERFICCNTNVTFKTLCHVVNHYKKHDIIVGEESWGTLSNPFEKEPDAEWYFGEISREDEKKLLFSEGHGSGSYLVRDGRSDKNQYVLAVNFQEEVKHFPIIPDKEETGFKLQNSPPFKTLSDLVEHYKEHGIESGTDVVELSKPCTKEQGTVESHTEKRWYFREMTTEEEEKLLDFQRNIQGSFLVRGGISNPDNYVLSVNHGGKIKRLTICREGDHFKCRNTGQYFKSLCDFVDHYTRNEIKVGADVWGKLLKPFEKKPEHEWYIGKCARSEEHTKLLHNGSFFVRDGNSDPNEYVLAVKVKGTIIHLPITQEADGYKLRDAKTNPFRTLLALVEHYTEKDIIIGSNVNHGKLKSNNG